MGAVISTEMVSLRSDDRAFEGFLASPVEGVKCPGLVVIHEIFGLTAWVRKVAERFAQQGFLALAPDLFVGRIHKEFRPEVAERVMPLVWQLPVEKRISPDAVRAALKGHRPEEVETAVRLAEISQGLEWMPPVLGDVRASGEFLRRHKACSGKVGTIGFCFGGRVSFHAATADPTLNAAVVFYGAGPREDEIDRIHCPVLGIYGEDDEYITKDVPRVDAAMKRSGKTFEYEVYNRTGHAFAREGSKNYKEDRAKLAFERTDAFLARALGA
jgi:carboxymethylenebutenolidase